MLFIVEVVACKTDDDEDEDEDVDVVVTGAIEVDGAGFITVVTGTAVVGDVVTAGDVLTGADDVAGDFAAPVV